MEFKKRKRRSADDHKEWVSDCGFFRITLFEQYGYRYYHASVKVERADGIAEPQFRWELAYRRGPYKTFKKAVEGCEKNKRLWDAFVKLSHSPGRRDSKLIELKVRAPYVFFTLPLWVRKEADPALIRMLFPCPHSTCDQDDLIETSKSSESPSSVPTSASSIQSESPAGPAPSATAKAGTTRKKTATASKATSSPPDTSAADVKEPAEAPAKRSKRSTTRKSPSSAKPSKPGKKQPGSGKAASGSSRKKKGKH